jgi:hypothetical protein
MAVRIVLAAGERCQGTSLGEKRSAQRETFASLARVSTGRRRCERPCFGAMGVGGDLAAPAIAMRMPLDIALGRWLAFCAHPVCAWRVRSTAARAMIVTSYFTAGYVGGLVALLLR